MVEYYFLYVCIGVLVYRAAEWAVVSVDAALYDIRTAKEQRHKRRMELPKVTVLVLAYNNEQSIGACLDALLRQSYTRAQIIVIDNASRDRTANILRSYKKRLRVIKRRVHSSPGAAYQAVSRYIAGDVVLLLRGDMLPDVDMSKNLSYVNLEQGAALLNLQVQAYPSLVTLMQRFDAFRYSQALKARTLLGRADNFAITAAPLLLSKQAYNKLGTTDQQHGRIHYAQGAIVYQQPRLQLRTILPQVATSPGTISRIVQYCEPFAIAYFFYLAYTGRNTTLLLMSIGLYVVWQCQLIWQESPAGFVQKIGLTLLTPLLYVLAFARGVAGGIFALANLRNTLASASLLRSGDESLNPQERSS